MAELFEVLDSMEVRGGSAKRTSKAAAVENGAQPLRGVGACKRGRSPGGDLPSSLPNKASRRGKGKGKRAFARCASSDVLADDRHTHEASEG